MYAAFLLLCGKHLFVIYSPQLCLRTQTSIAAVIERLSISITRFCSVIMSGQFTSGSCSFKTKQKQIYYGRFAGLRPRRSTPRCETEVRLLTYFFNFRVKSVGWKSIKDFAVRAETTESQLTVGTCSITQCVDDGITTEETLSFLRVQLLCFQYESNSCLCVISSLCQRLMHQVSTATILHKLDNVEG